MNAMMSPRGSQAGSRSAPRSVVSRSGSEPITAIRSRWTGGVVGRSVGDYGDSVAAAVPAFSGPVAVALSAVASLAVGSFDGRPVVLSSGTEQPITRTANIAATNTKSFIFLTKHPVEMGESGY